ncbi:sulfate/thiosulfate import ATP-binding protein cysa, putative [Heliomicrobium modesticaldum Ice1]|uniref:ABC-type quaternary amine transporter n=1 Tax=Heliobacterium modesticaldum (strain ATCC 51547 / Ice1) TaxID=498761 RepID=B0THG2_HELMI|nr:ABC transporter ATP-binding protein [Heliomicrobium modesticaldum]ABZ83400.1 sulfate/thiosulfate import ATP-binding protein cysa, putative [Heliomicrobium modesticaldum Ice1]
MAVAVEVRRLRKCFGSGQAPVVDDISFQLPAGGVTALLGPSGGGKTTLLRMIAGLEAPTSGEVIIDERPVNHLPPQQREIGFVFQSYALFQHMNVFENIAFGLKMKGWTKRAIEERVHELVAVTGITGLERRYPSQLSGGQQQRVAFARALAPKPRLLLLDEPFAAVDAQIRKELRLWLRQLHDEIPVTSIFVTHDQQEALELADRVAVIQRGKLEQLGTPQEIYEHPATPFVGCFIGDGNWFRLVVRDDFASVGRWRFSVPSFADGEQVDMLIRPEDVLVHPETDVRERGAFNRGRVVSSVFLGQDMRLDLLLDEGLRVTALLPKESGQSLCTGERVIVGVKGGKWFPVIE